LRGTRPQNGGLSVKALTRSGQGTREHVLSATSPSVKEGAKADVLNLGEPGFEGVERLALEQVGDHHPMAFMTQVVSELLDTGRQLQGVVEHNEVGQACSFAGGP
jgi:hypothetical protein